MPPDLRELSPMGHPGYIDAGRVALGTFIGYDRRLVGRVWRPLSRVHRRLAPGLLISGRRTLVDCVDLGVRS